jgi:hypothetical protein
MWSFYKIKIGISSFLTSEGIREKGNRLDKYLTVLSGGLVSG